MLTASEEGTLDSSGRDLTSSKVDPQARKPKVKQMKLTATGNLQSSGFTVDKETQEVIPQRRFSMSFRSSSVSSSGDDISKMSTSIGTSLRKSFIGKGSRNHDQAADPLKHSSHRSSASLLGESLPPSFWSEPVSNYPLPFQVLMPTWRRRRSKRSTRRVYVIHTTLTV